MTYVKRRTFLKGMSLALATSLVSPFSLLARPSKQKEFKQAKYPTLTFDVIVVGAGPGGIPAAIRAAQQGATVALVEEDQHVGGAPVDMYVDALFGKPRVGISKQLEEELFLKHSIYNLDTGIKAKGSRFFLPSSYIQVNNKMLTAEKNITLFCGTPAVNAIVVDAGNKNKVTGVRILRNGYLQELKAHVVIDATGTGLIAAMSGCEFMFGTDAKSDNNELYGSEVATSKVQSCTQMFISQRIKKDAIFPEGFKGSAAEDGYVGGNRQKKEELESRATGIFFHWGQTIQVEDPCDPIQLSNAQRWCIEQYESRFAELHDAGFEVHIAPKIGVRECRRIKGDYLITTNDLHEGVQHEDKIADAQYSLDAWGMKLPEEAKHVKPYTIPFRAIVPVATEGLLTSGRIISGTHLAHSSYRVQRICSNIGEAAGVAAAMAALNKTSTRNIDIKQLQRTLSNYGLFDGFNK